MKQHNLNTEEAAVSGEFPQTLSIHNARLQVFTKLVGPPGQAFLGGPVLEDPAYAKLRHLRYGAPYDGLNPQVDYRSFVEGEWNYLGAVYHHFGHVMAETVHRVLPSMTAFSCRKWIAVTYPGGPTSWADLPEAYRSALEYFDIKNVDLKVISDNSVVERLNIAEEGSNLGAGPHSTYLSMLTDFARCHPGLQLHDNEFSPKVYVSRSNINHGGSFLGEKYLEKCLFQEGFRIYHPEDYPLIDQMRTYSSARLILFPEGSACHGAELLGRGSLNKVYALMRRNDHFGTIGAVLRPRSHHFAMLAGMPFLGTARRRAPGQEPLPEFGVSVFDLRKLDEFLRINDLARIHALERESYFDAALDDFDAYIRYHQAMGSPLVDSTEIDRMRHELLEHRRSSVYLGENGAMKRSDQSKLLVSDHEGEHYHNVLAKCHEIIAPQSYLEIGCFSGVSLRLAKCIALGVDPDLTKLAIDLTGVPTLMLFQMTSDMFFQRFDVRMLLGSSVALVFLDGMHLIEYLLRDFINAERACGKDSLIVLHDCIPTDAFVGDRVNDQKLRPEHPDWWAGDVWKIIPILRKYRPDIKLTCVDAPPTGLVVVSNLDPLSSKLADCYSEIISQWQNVVLSEYGLDDFNSVVDLQSTKSFLSDLKARVGARVSD